MPIQIIPKPAEKGPLWVDILFYFSLFLLILTIAVYFILNNMQQKINKEIFSLDAELNRIDASSEVMLEKEVLAQQAKITDFSNLTSNYLYILPIFDFIGKLTHPKIVFSIFSVSANANMVQVSGLADSFQTVGQQLLIFKNEKLIKQTELSNVSIGEKGKIPFNFTLLLDPGVFKKNKKNE